MRKRMLGRVTNMMVGNLMAGKGAGRKKRIRKRRKKVNSNSSKRMRQKKRSQNFQPKFHKKLRVQLKNSCHSLGNSSKIVAKISRWRVVVNSPQPLKVSNRTGIWVESRAKGK